ncbi:MAG: Ppx/GppA phosphatase family protein [Nitratireductor sp.]
MLPNRGKRRRKGSSHRGNENQQAELAASDLREEDHGSASSTAKTAGAQGESFESGGHKKPAHLKKGSGFSKQAPSHFGSKNSGENPSSQNANPAHQRGQNSRGSHKHKPNHLRNMRAPVSKTPAASYEPVEVAAPAKRPFERKHESHKSKGRPHKQRIYAALDLGTNNCRLLLAIPQERGRFRVIDGFSKIVRLGEGLTHSGKLSDEAMDRAVGALKICATKLGNYDIRLKRLIATEACRQASNGEAFLKRVELEAGIKLEIIDRETEARLAAEGCGALMDKKADAGVLFDIGGGSSELILVNRRQGKKRISDQIVAWNSLPVGVVTLAERFGGEFVSAEIFKKMVAEVCTMLNDFPDKGALDRIWKNGKVHLLGTSGTVTTLAGIHLKLARYDRRLVDGLWLSDKEIDKVLESLIAMNYQQRAASPCIGVERADLVMAGCAILEAIRITWPAKRLRVADRGLREGILTQLMDRDGAWIKPKKGRWPRKRGFAGKKQAGKPTFGEQNG